MDNIRIETDMYKIDITGNADDIKGHLNHALEAIRESLTFAPLAAISPNSDESNTDGIELPGHREGTINTVVSKLSANTCRELLMAAAAHLTLFEGREKFTKQEWQDRAKDANAWKKAFSRQRAESIKKFIDDGRIVENSADVFSLPESLRIEIDTKLSN